MRKYTQSITLLLLSAVVLFAACKKESGTTGTLPPKEPDADKQLLSNMFAGLKPVPQSFQINAGAWKVIYGAKKTRLIFYPNSFKDKQGNIISSGQIDIKLIEAYKPGEVISNRSSATGSGRLLMSGGQVYLKAYRAGQEVYPNVYGIGFSQQAASTQPMNLFYGSNNNGDSTVIWTQAGVNNGTTAPNGTITDSLGQIFYQFDSCTSFNWINCDYFYNTNSPLTNLFMVAPDTGFNGGNTQVFLVFPAINSVTWMGTYTSGTHTFSMSPNYFVPVGMSFHTISISMNNGNYYYDEKLNLNVSSNMVDTLHPQQKTLPDILNALSLL